MTGWAYGKAQGHDSSSRQTHTHTHTEHLCWHIPTLHTERLIVLLAVFSHSFTHTHTLDFLTGRHTHTHSIFWQGERAETNITSGRVHISPLELWVCWHPRFFWNTGSLRPFLPASPILSALLFPVPLSLHYLIHPIQVYLSVLRIWGVLVKSLGWFDLNGG